MCHFYNNKNNNLLNALSIDEKYTNGIMIPDKMSTDQHLWREKKQERERECVKENNRENINIKNLKTFYPSYDTHTWHMQVH